MRTTKIQTAPDNTKYVNALSKVMPRNNGTQSGIDALAASLERSKHLTAQPSIVKEESHV